MFRRPAINRPAINRPAINRPAINRPAINRPAINREEMLVLISAETRSDDLEIGELLVCVAVGAANVVKDIHQNIRNLIGGRMVHYEKLVESTVERAFAELDEKAKTRGYDGVVGVKIAHPTVVDGGVEIVVYGNGFRYKR